jgi:diguanylate cyclase (GGDEF)-like protein
MRTACLIRRLLGVVTDAARRSIKIIGGWHVWKLREPLRSYVIALPVLAIVAVCSAVPGTHWRATQVTIFAALVACAAIAIEATRTVNEPRGTVTRDLQSVWYLAVAIALPPVYALAAPIPLTAYKLWRVPRMVVYRRVFSNATLSLAYGCASLVFHTLPPTIAGPTPGHGSHVLIWTAAVIACGVLAWAINNAPLALAVRLADPATRLRSVLGSAEAMILDLVELSLAVSLSFLVTINPVLMTLALPSLVLHRRHLLHGQLVNQTRIDAKTGLLNAATWQREASAELDRAIRTRIPLALAMVDIDHFKNVNDTLGHLAGDHALSELARLFKQDLRDYDLIGRFGGEEFTILLPHTTHAEATFIAERLRDRVARQLITIDDGSKEGFTFTVTISIGLATLAGARRDLNDLVAAADNALYQAKKAGRNRVHALIGADDEPHMPPSGAETGG